jgi:5-oxoprolinase (ATP-hydrolysing)
VVRTRFAELASEISLATGRDTSPEEAAAGFLKISVEQMANAIKKISVQRGCECFAKPIAKMGLLRVILYYLNPFTPLKNT